MRVWTKDICHTCMYKVQYTKEYFNVVTEIIGIKLHKILYFKYLEIDGVGICLTQ